MRLLGRLLTLLVLLPLAYYGYQETKPLFALIKKTPHIEGRLASATPSTVYVLSEENWTEFDITSPGEHIKVLSSANIPIELSYDDLRIWRYALEYELIDADGEVLESGIYHHRSKVIYITDPETNDIFTRGFYLGKAFVPTTSSSLLVGVKDANYPLRLRVKAVISDTEIVDIAVRVYQPSPTLEHRLAVVWQRTNIKAREFLARGSVYSPEYLRTHEIANLLRNRTEPIGPIGIRGEDYHDRDYYFLGDIGEEFIGVGDANILPAGIFIDNWLRAVIPVPIGGESYDLRFKALGPPIEANEKVLVRWYGIETDERKQQWIIASETKPTQIKMQEGGLIEIISSRPLVVNATTQSNQLSEQPVSAASAYMRGFVTTPIDAVEYRVDHVEKDITPFRVDLRGYAEQSQQQPPYTEVAYELIADNGRIIKTGKLPIDTELTPYDRFSGDIEGHYLTEPARYYFALPKQIAAIRFYSHTPALVSAYTRPDNLIRQVRIPEDYYDITNSDDNRQPAWFIVKPKNQTNLSLADRSKPLLIQRRPPEDNEDVMAGRYDWQDFPPQGNGLAQYLLVKRESRAPLRDQSLSTVYHQVSVNNNYNFEFRGTTHRPDIKPQLVVIRGNNAPIEVEVLLDGIRVLDAQLVGQIDSFELPRIVAGKHSLEIHSSGKAEFFINHVRANEELYIKRRANRLDNNRLDFLYEKLAEEELVSAQVFLPHDAKQRAQVRVQVESTARRGIGPFRDWSFASRLGSITHQHKETNIVLNTQDAIVGQAQRMFIPLGSDLPNGVYRISIEVEQGEVDYLALYRLLPGSFDRRNFFIESLFDDVAIP